MACNGVGHCDIINEDTYLHACKCHEGYHGSACDLCKSDFEKVGNLCIPPACITGENECNGNGICSSETGDWTCKCHP